jgi:hypothetical protein
MGDRKSLLQNRPLSPTLSHEGRGSEKGGSGLSGGQFSLPLKGYCSLYTAITPCRRLNRKKRSSVIRSISRDFEKRLLLRLKRAGLSHIERLKDSIRWVCALICSS